ncbi:hypothetical protein PGTUg99_012744 [Puccinia graminis f. sp. tritici]|uniref:Uncharacterized protein n=2 Tax=Puccinia graminis f. sp. tritici TaxID=56615 RepID=A0A5B0PF86_PUCGR|nr:hypothetical protein PGTUg99_012744 [Puccinia graminis f. sp. tritici]
MIHMELVIEQLKTVRDVISTVIQEPGSICRKDGMALAGAGPINQLDSCLRHLNKFKDILTYTLLPLQDNFLTSQTTIKRARPHSMLAGWSIISDQPNIHALPDVPLTANFSSTIGFGRNDTNNGGAMGISEIYNPVSVEEFVHNSNETHSSDPARSGKPEYRFRFREWAVEIRHPAGFLPSWGRGLDGYLRVQRSLKFFVVAEDDMFRAPDSTLSAPAPSTPHHLANAFKFNSLKTRSSCAALGNSVTHPQVQSPSTASGRTADSSGTLSNTIMDHLREDPRFGSNPVKTGTGLNIRGVRVRYG